MLCEASERGFIVPVWLHCIKFISVSLIIGWKQWKSHLLIDHDH